MSMAVLGMSMVVLGYGAYLAMLFALRRFTYRTWLFHAVILVGIVLALIGLALGDAGLPAWIAIGLGLAWFPLTRRELTLVGSERLTLQVGDRLPRFDAQRPDGTPFTGVPHIALSKDAYTDAQPEPFGDPVEVRAPERAELTSWRAAGGPVLGRELDAGVTTLMTIRADEGFGAAKLLHLDRSGVHVRLYADRWSSRLEEFDPWALRLGQIEDKAMGIGHLPMSRSAFANWEPNFARLVMFGASELDGYRTWLDAGGGYFA